MELMEPEGLFAAPVKSFADAFSDEQVSQQRMIVTIDSPVGELKLPAPPYRLSRTPAAVRTAPPRHGEHTDEVLQSAGFSRDEIAALRRKEAI
jgi:succinate--hydroxymethylglutarate CoA-transferase